MSHPTTPPLDPERRQRRRAALEAVLVVVLVAGVVGAAVAGAWFSAATAARRNYQAHLVSLARVAALQVDASLHGLLRQPDQIDGPVFRRAVEPLRRMRENVPGIRYLYTIAKDGEHVRIVVDSADAGDRDGDGIEDRSGVWELSRSPQVAKLEALGMTGSAPRPAATEEPYSDDWGTFMSGYAPFYDRAGRLAGAAGVDVDASGYTAQVRDARRQVLVGALPAVAMVLLLGFAVYWQRLATFRATHQLREAARAAEHASRHDRLTGLANRTAFTEAVDAALERIREGRQACCAVLFLDFDHFKFINDTLGHDAGDELLRQIAARLRAALGGPAAAAYERNVVARFGGDEFVVLLNGLRHEGDVAALAHGLLSILAPPYVLKGNEVRSSASVGIRTAGRDAPNVETLLRHADVAMYQAKASGRGCFVLFDDAMRARLERRQRLEAHLLHAVGSREITLEYVPIVELQTGRHVAVEAVLSWTHPDAGPVPRQELCDIAEESGLVVALGEWSLREACHHLADWRRRDPDGAPAFVSMSLARAELALGSRLVDGVRGALAATGLPASCLQLEIAERVATDPRPAIASVLDGLRALGVRLSMGGFGASSTSLACLRSHAFDAVKVTHTSLRGLASNRDALALAHATLTLLENLGMAGIADGVDDPAQLAVLQSLGCRYAQGPLFSKPPAAAGSAGVGLVGNAA